MIARLESGEVSLTTRMGDVFLRFRQSVLAGDAAFAQLHDERVMIQTRQARGLAQGKPPERIVAAGQLDLHVPLPFSRTEGQAGQGFRIEIEGDAHGRTVAAPKGGVNHGKPARPPVQNLSPTFPERFSPHFLRIAWTPRTSRNDL